jgi:class 3 adenylate cyclase/tetratricopeptide (TPR) repeat protein
LIQCPRCQAENRDDARFCRQCGNRVGATCPACGAPAEAGNRFCDVCGTALASSPEPAVVVARFASPEHYTPRHLAERILTERAAVEGERKQVTILFADVKGSLELLADRDPEEMRQVLDPVLDRMIEAVHRYEGTVNQVMGDGIMALFGAPLALEDHALRACYAALAMQAEVGQLADDLRRTHGVTLQIRVGLNSGEVLIRAIGSDLRMEYSAIGLTAHLASRMEQLAPPGHTLMTPETLSLVEGYVQVVSEGLVPIKGLGQPMEAFRLLGTAQARTRIQAGATRGLTRFVGRQRELDAIGLALETAAGGQGQVLALVGDAGVGKSRLVWETVRSERVEGWLALESRSVSYGRAAAYGPVRDLLRAFFRIREKDDRRTIQDRVTAKVLTLDHLLEETIAAVLAVLDAVPEGSPFLQFDPLERRQRTLEAIKRLFIRESQIQPLLVVVEDLHWIDSETQALLDRLVESLTTARILLLVNYRPEYHHSWASKASYAQVRVDPLSPVGADELLAALLGQRSELTPLKQLLMERTAGNPFFLEECVRTLVETRVVEGERGAYRFGRPLETIKVPPTVQAVLAARIDRLPAAQKNLLQTASVIGKDVSFPVLKAITDLPEGELRSRLTDLQGAAFLHEVSLFPELEYSFNHTLTHEVTYGGLVQERRRILHGRIVTTLERLGLGHPGERVERLAQHAVRGAVWDKAVRYLREAGAKATEQSAYRQGIACLEQALEAQQHLPQTAEQLAEAIDLRFDLRNALFALGELEQIFNHLAQAKALAERLGDRRRLGWVSAYMTHYYWRVGDHRSAIESGQRAVAIGNELADVALQSTNVNLGLAYYAVGDYSAAIACLQKTIGALEGQQRGQRLGWAGLPAVTSRAYMVGCLAELGRFAAGIPIGEEAVRIAEQANHAFSLGQAYVNLGVLYLRKGDLDLATAVLERGPTVSGLSKVSALAINIAATLGYAYALSGRSAEALALLEDAVQRAGGKRIMARQSVWTTWLSEAYLLAGRDDDSLAQARQALVLTRESGERGNEAHVLRLLGDIAVGRKVVDERSPEAWYQEAGELAETLGMGPLVALCQLRLGTWYRAADRRPKAAQSLRSAADQFRSMEMSAWLARAEAELADTRAAATAS